MSDLSTTNESETGSPFLDEKLTELRARISELRPLVEEYNKLTAAETALGGPLEPSEPVRRGRGRKA